MHAACLRCLFCLGVAQALPLVKMTEEELRELLKSWNFEEEDATAYAGQLWRRRIRNLDQIADAEKADLAAVLAGGQELIDVMHNVHASNMIAKAARESPLLGWLGGARARCKHVMRLRSGSNALPGHCRCTPAMPASQLLMPTPEQRHSTPDALTPMASTLPIHFLAALTLLLRPGPCCRCRRRRRWCGRGSR